MGTSYFTFELRQVCPADTFSDIPHFIKRTEIVLSALHGLHATLMVQQYCTLERTHQAGIYRRPMLCVGSDL